MFYYCYRVVSSFHKVNKTFEKHLNEEFSSLFKKYTKITEVNLSLFVKYRYNLIYLYLSNTDKLSSVIFVYKAHY